MLERIPIPLSKWLLKWKTRMHSSRMRTGRSLTICCSLLPRGDLPARGGFSLPGGSSLPWRVLPAQGRWFLPARGRGEVLPARRPPPPPVNRSTDTCKNITLATTSLRPVIIICGEISLNVRENSVSISNNFMLIAHCPQTWNNKNEWQIDSVRLFILAAIDVLTCWGFNRCHFLKRRRLNQNCKACNSLYQYWS